MTSTVIRAGIITIAAILMTGCLSGKRADAQPATPVQNERVTLLVTNSSLGNTCMLKLDAETGQALKDIGLALKLMLVNASVRTQYISQASQTVNSPIRVTLDDNSLALLSKIVAKDKSKLGQYMPILVLIGAAVTGAIGFYLANFVMQPILFYRRIKQDIASELIIYANAIAPSPGGNNGTQQQRVEERISAQRKRSAELTAVYITLPKLYKWLLKQRDELPDEAASELLGLSNTMDYKVGPERMKRIQTLLKLPRIAA